MLAMHRRWGKTVLEVNKLIARALKNPLERPRYAYVAPLYRQAKQVTWDYLRHFAGVIPGTKFNESELRCDLPNGSRITLFGADNYDALRGIYLDGAVLDEYGQMPSKIWTEVIRPALSDRKGWADFIGTPKGKNAFYDVYNFALNDADWFTAIERASETGIIEQSELISARRAMGEDEYMQEYECSWEAAIPGAYWAEQIREAREARRICKVPFDKRMPVSTFWDLGHNDTTAILFLQVYGAELRLFDAYEQSGESLEHYAGILQQKGYIYETHYLPHDAASKSIQTGKSCQELLTGMGITNTSVVPRTINKLTDIHAVRSIFPKLWIDEVNCKVAIEAWMQYHKKFDDKRKTYLRQPEHDWSSNYADALMTLAVGFQEPIIQDLRQPVSPLHRPMLG